MRIAFDLDDTLIPSEHQFATEPPPTGLLARWFALEPLRLGTVQLLTELRRQGHEVCIYTTSLRQAFATKMLFRCYGIPVRRVINENEHQRAVRQLGDWLALSPEQWELAQLTREPFQHAYGQPAEAAPAVARVLEPDPEPAG